METWYDMHCHLGFAPDPARVAMDGAAADINALSCTVEPAEYERLRAALAGEHNIALGLGAHPWWIADGRVGNAELERFCVLAPVAPYIGEIGLDFAGPRDTDQSRARQVDALSRILTACDENTSTGLVPRKGRDETEQQKEEPRQSGGKLISIHAVNATGIALDLLEQANTPRRHRVIFHWFSGTSEELARARDLGCYFSVGPRMLVSRRGREYARQIPLDRLLLETDMPSRAGDSLPANVWQAELNNALTGIAQLKAADRGALAAQIATTSAELLRF